MTTEGKIDKAFLFQLEHYNLFIANSTFLMSKFCLAGILAVESKLFRLKLNVFPSYAYGFNIKTSNALLAHFLICNFDGKISISYHENESEISEKSYIQIEREISYDYDFFLR